MTSPDKAGHAADLHVEDMQILQADEKEAARTMLERMLALSAFAVPDSAAGTADAPSPAFDQRKCRKLGRYPASIEE